MLEAGATAEVIDKRLGRKSVNETRLYLERLAQQPDIGVRRRNKAEQEENWAPDRGPNRMKLRHYLTLKHGLQAKYLPEMERLEAEGDRPVGQG